MKQNSQNWLSNSTRVYNLEEGSNAAQSLARCQLEGERGGMLSSGVGEE